MKALRHLLAWALAAGLCALAMTAYGSGRMQLAFARIGAFCAW